MNLSSLPIKTKGFYLESIDDELLLYHPEHARALYLNDTAALVWQMCDGRDRIIDIIEILKDSFPESAEVIPDEVEETLKKLLKARAVQLV